MSKKFFFVLALLVTILFSEIYGDLYQIGNRNLRWPPLNELGSSNNTHCLGIFVTGQAKKPTVVIDLSDTSNNLPGLGPNRLPPVDESGAFDINLPVRKELLRN